ncbi:MAG: hypothetical protein KDB03_07495 [Planctomycetales bacterium]|nr:hypothetical protein [Planctomycetales bacterium]
MKRVMLGLTLAFTLLSGTGCNVNRNCNNCNGNIGCRPCNIGWQRGGTDYQRLLGGNQAHAGSGQAAQVAYPYYTTRGPRDFLLNDPPTIGR